MSELTLKEAERLVADAERLRQAEALIHAAKMEEYARQSREAQQRSLQSRIASAERTLEILRKADAALSEATGEELASVTLPGGSTVGAFAELLQSKGIAEAERRVQALQRDLAELAEPSPEPPATAKPAKA